jgi:hypothetical protein
LSGIWLRRSVVNLSFIDVIDNGNIGYIIYDGGVSAISRTGSSCISGIISSGGIGGVVGGGGVGGVINSGGIGHVVLSAVDLAKVLVTLGVMMMVMMVSCVGTVRRGLLMVVLALVSKSETQ